MKKPYNVILIGIDTLRADHLGYHGYSRKTSPNLDRFAEANMYFENCYSQAPNTSPSFMSIMTSLYPSYHGILSIVSSENGGRAYVLGKNIYTLAEILKNNGFKTAAFTDGAQLDPMFGFGKGFDYYSTNAGTDKKRGQGTIPEDDIFYYLKENANKQFFLFLHTFAVHSPWKAPWKYINYFDNGYIGPLKITDAFPDNINWLQDNRDGVYRIFTDKVTKEQDPEAINYHKNIYDGAIRYIDDFFASLQTILSETGLDKNTVIVFTSDHGEEFLDHGMLRHRQLYNELLHVPLIISSPEKIEKKINQIARSIDITPTILDLLGIESNWITHGTSLLSTLKEDLKLSAIAETERQGFSIQNKKYKLINHVKKIFLDELYDLENDPHEQDNIAIANLDIVEEMRWEFENELHKFPSLRPRKKTIYLAPHLIKKYSQLDFNHID